MLKIGNVRVGKLPSELEKLADEHRLDHDIVALDALYRHQQYILEEGKTREEAYNMTMQHLQTSYELGGLQ